MALAYERERYKISYVTDNGEKVGAIMYTRSGRILEIYVHDQYRRKGYGSQLVSNAIKTMWFPHIYGYSEHPFWEKIGFYRVCERVIKL
jgi:GNAT superfamily N-acetyltransferase